MSSQSPFDPQDQSLAAKANAFGAEEPPILDPETSIPGSRPLNTTYFSPRRRPIASLEPLRIGRGSLLDVLKREAYGAPRVFDLFTLLAVTVAFALLFGFLKLIEPALADQLPVIAVGVSFFVTGIAVGQLTLWQGAYPRLASLVVGPLLWVVLIVGTGLGFSWSALTISAFVSNLLAALCSSPIGIFLGYLGGAVVAGVFLVADALRNRLRAYSARSGEKPARFDEIE